MSHWLSASQLPQPLPLYIRIYKLWEVLWLDQATELVIASCCIKSNFCRMLQSDLRNGSFLLCRTGEDKTLK